MAKPWSTVAADPAFEALTNEEKAATQRAYFDEVLVPQLKPEEIDPTRTAFFSDFDYGNNQGVAQGMANSAAQGFGKGVSATFLTGPGAVLEAVGLDENELLKAGKATDKEIEKAFPVSPENEQKFFVKAAGAVGQAGSMLAVYPFSGASTGFRAATMAGKARQIALLGGFQGASAGEARATELNINDPLVKSLVIAGYGSAEFISEKIGGYGVESGISKVLGGELAETGIRQVIKQGAVEGLEEVGAGVPQRMIDRAVSTEDPARPGFTIDGQAIPAPWDVGQITEEFALGAIAGSGMTMATEVLNKLTPAQQRDAKAVAGMPRPVRQSTYEQLQEVNAEEAKVLAVANTVDEATAANVRLAMDGRRANILSEAAKTTEKEYTEGWQERQRATLVQNTDAGLTIQINGQWFQETGKNPDGTSILEPLTNTAKLEQEREEWIQTGDPPEGWAQPEASTSLEGQPAEASAAPTVQPAPAMGAEMQQAQGPAFEGEPVVFVTDIPLKGLPEETLLPAENGGMYRIWTPAPGRKAVETIPPTPQPPKETKPSIAERFPEPVRSEESQAARGLTVTQKGKALAMWSERKSTADIAEALNIPVGVVVEAKAQLGVPAETIPQSGEMIENPAFSQWRDKINAKVRKKSLPAHPVEGTVDVLDWLAENPLYVPPKAQRVGRGEYDFLDNDDRISRYFRQFITTPAQGSYSVNEAATRAYEEGRIPEPSVDALADAVQKAITDRKTTRAQAKREGARISKAEGQTTAFYRDTADGPVRIDPGELVKDDVLMVEDTPLKVTAVDYNEDGYVESVTLQDGAKYGVQTISGDYVFLVDEFRPSSRRPAGEQGEFLPAGTVPEDAFALEDDSAAEIVQEAETLSKIKPSPTVEVHVIKEGVLTTESRKPSSKLLASLVEQRKIYNHLRNCLNS